MLKNILIPLSFFFVTAGLQAQQYKPADAGSSVKFAIKNFGLTVDGSFKGLQGNITFNPANLSASVFNVSVDVATVNTGNGKRDTHLKKEEYFDIAKYPKINFTAKKITAAAKPGQYTMEGTVTIKGVSKPVSFPFSVSASANGNLFTGQFKINRRNFRVGGNSMVLSDDVTVILNIAAVKQ
jgi:polyisoprenoid-binding protein YceI